MTVLSLSGAVAAGSFSSASEPTLLRAGAFVGAIVTLWLWVLLPLIRIARNADRVHKLLLGDGPDHPDLQTRLAQGDARMGRIEEKVDSLGGIDGKVDTLGDRIEKVEGSLDVLAATERQDVRRALVAVDERTRRRRIGDV